MGKKDKRKFKPTKRQLIAGIVVLAAEIGRAHV